MFSRRPAKDGPMPVAGYAATVRRCQHRPRDESSRTQDTARAGFSCPARDGLLGRGGCSHSLRRTDRLRSATVWAGHKSPARWNLLRASAPLAHSNMPIKWAPNPPAHSRVQAFGAFHSHPRLRQVPETAVLKNLADNIALAGFDEGDGLYGPAATGAEQRVCLVKFCLVNSLDEHGPALALEPGRRCDGRLLLLGAGKLGKPSNRVLL